MKIFITTLLAAMLTDNYVLSRSIGICPFLGGSQKLSSSLGMGGAVIFVMGCAAAVTYPVYQLLAMLELTYLKTVREKEVAELIKEARSFGDLSENSEYDEAKNEQGKLYSRMAELEEILSNYTLIEDAERSADMIHVGTTVVVRDLEFDEELTYEIVGSQEADPMNGRISEESPFGRALLGRKIGEEVIVEAPAGNIKYQILKIER